MTRIEETHLQMLRRYATESPDETWLIVGGVEYSWAAALEEVARAAVALRVRGVLPGSRVVIAALNCAETVWAHLATMGLGALTVPVDPGQSARYLKHVVDTTDPTLMITSSDAASKGMNDLLRARPCPAVELMRISDDSVVDEAEVALLAAEELWSQTAVEPAGIMFTSGTTGAPKGILSVDYDLGPVRELQRRAGVADEKRWFSCLPLYHANALYLSLLGSIAFRRQLWLARSFSKSAFWHQVQSSSATTFNVVGGLSQLLLEGESDFHFDRTVPILSAGTPWSVKEEFERRFNVRVIEWWGMTDFPGILANLDQVPGSIGRPLGVSEFGVSPVAGEEPTPPRGTAAPSTHGTAQGELVMRHPRGRVTSYWANASATDASYDDGWFRTGDIVDRDADGNYFFKGRAKRMIRRMGENISAWEIETILAGHPAVERVVAIGVADDVVGEEILALVVLRKGGRDTTPRDLGQWCLNEFPRGRVPRYVRIVADIAVGASFRPTVSRDGWLSADGQLWDARSKMDPEPSVPSTPGEDFGDDDA